jgi:predicted ATP-grasp superfamily ATP-dependent carboligase
MKSACADTLPPAVVIAGSDWGGTLGTIRSLGRRGVPVHVISGKKERAVYAASRYVREMIPLDTDGPREMVLDGLVAWAAKRKVAAKIFLVPHSDRDCADIVRHRARFEEHFCLAMPSAELVMASRTRQGPAPLPSRMASMSHPMPVSPRRKSFASPWKGPGAPLS